MRAVPQTFRHAGVTGYMSRTDLCEADAGGDKPSEMVERQSVGSDKLKVNQVTPEYQT